MWIFYFSLIIFVTFHFNFTVIAIEPGSISLVSLFPRDTPIFCGLKDLRQSAPENLVWDAKYLRFSSHTNFTFLTMRSSTLTSPRWTKIPLQYDSHQPAIISKVQEKERQMCKLVFIETGLRLGLGIEERICKENSVTVVGVPVWVVGLLLLLLLSSSSSSPSSLSPLCRVFILIFLRQTLSLGNTVLQLFCCYYSWCLYR